MHIETDLHHHVFDANIPFIDESIKKYEEKGGKINFITCMYSRTF